MYNPSPSLVGTTPTLNSQNENIAVTAFIDPTRFNPNDSITYKDSPKRSPVGAGLTVSNFNHKRSSAAIPNHQGSGYIKGQKIAIKDKPIKHNLLKEFNLKNHFLRKLEELREMKREYY